MSTATFPTSFPQSPGLSDEALARRLDQRPESASWGLLETVLLGVPSFGILPLLLWPSNFRKYVAEESAAMQDLAEWAKRRGRQPAAIGPLLASAKETALSPLPMVMSLVLAALMVGVFGIEFNHVPFSVHRLLQFTYQHEFRHYAPPLGSEFLHRVWVICLSIGFTVQWLQIRAHVSEVRRFVTRFNPVAAAEMLPAIRFPKGGWAYFRPLWIVTAIILAFYGAWWGIPMVLAGMAQRRYTKVTGPLVRRELAKRVKDVIALRGLPGVFTPIASGRRCGNPRCLAVIRPQANFCTRCGAQTSQRA